MNDLLDAGSNLLNDIKRISDYSKNEKYNIQSVITKYRESILPICEKLELTEKQTVIFAILLRCYEGRNITISEFSEKQGKDSLDIVSDYLEDLEKLEENCFLSISEEGRFNREACIEIPFSIIKMLKENKKPRNIYSKKDSIEDFLAEIAFIFGKHLEKDVPLEETSKRIFLLLKNNIHFSMVKKIKSYNLSDDDVFLIFAFLYNLLEFEKEEVRFDDIMCFMKNQGKFRAQVKTEDTVLQKNGLIEYSNTNGFANTEIFKLTKKAREEFLSEIDLHLPKKMIKNLILPKDINEKKLFYPQKTEKQIKELCELLQMEKFKAVQRNLKEKRMRTGFACLFTGEPGTGKTETALQLAKITGRGIIQVDIAESKSKWFGESEKKIKEIFSNYKNAVKALDITPILLFNEADAIIGKRHILSDEKQGAGQTENSIQNIILQEIENLDGILIATTNLAKNMDRAFERRFLYKIEFEKPNIETRASIWQTMLPNLQIQEAEELATQFNFSGGQIENIARKNMVKNTLYGRDLNFTELLETTKEESSDCKEFRKMGF